MRSTSLAVTRATCADRAFYLGNSTSMPEITVIDTPGSKITHTSQLCLGLKAVIILNFVFFSSTVLVLYRIFCGARKTLILHDVSKMKNRNEILFLSDFDRTLKAYDNYFFWENEQNRPCLLAALIKIDLF